MNILEDFKQDLNMEQKSKNTIYNYLLSINQYIEWFNTSYGKSFEKLYRENIIEYISYLKNIKKLNYHSINSKIAALIKFNEFMQPDNLVISKKDTLRVQNSIANPTDITKKDVEFLRQSILESSGSTQFGKFKCKRDYSIITIMAYAGLRISEVLNIKFTDFNLTSQELLVRDSKGNKQRTVILNNKIVETIKAYLVEREKLSKLDSDYLFVSDRNRKISKNTINRVLNKFSNKITPHSLRHFYCTNALEHGLSIHEVAQQAGHSNIHTTLIYANPKLSDIKEKLNKL